MQALLFNTWGQRFLCVGTSTRKINSSNKGHTVDIQQIQTQCGCHKTPPIIPAYDLSRLTSRRNRRLFAPPFESECLETWLTANEHKDDEYSGGSMAGVNVTINQPVNRTSNEAHWNGTDANYLITCNYLSNEHLLLSQLLYLPSCEWCLLSIAIKEPSVSDCYLMSLLCYYFKISVRVYIMHIDLHKRAFFDLIS